MPPDDHQRIRLARRSLMKRTALTAGIVGFGMATIPETAQGMNKGELIDRIADDADLTKADAKRALDAFIDNTTESLRRGEAVNLGGFGRFHVTSSPPNCDNESKKEEAGGRRNGESEKRPTFKPGKDLAEAVK